jgi:hypothetical protein
MRLLFAQKAMPRLENLELGFRVQVLEESRAYWALAR